MHNHLFKTLMLGSKAESTLFYKHHLYMLVVIFLFKQCFIHNNVIMNSGIKKFGKMNMRGPSKKGGKCLHDRGVIYLGEVNILLQKYVVPLCGL